MKIKGIMIQITYLKKIIVKIKVDLIYYMSMEKNLFNPKRINPGKKLN